MFYLLLGGFLVKKFILVMLLFMFSIISFGNENQFMKEIFERKGLNGTFVVYDLKNDKIDYYNCHTDYICSTTLFRTYI